MKKFTHLVIIAVTMVAAGASHAQQIQVDAGRVKAIGDDACKCAADISIALTKSEMLEKVNECITTSALMAGAASGEMNTVEAIQEAAKDYEIDSTATGEMKVKAYVGEDFGAIQSYMYQNCEALKQLMQSDNVKRDKSMSNNKQALRYYNEGLDYDQAGQLDRAIQSYTKAVKEDPEFAFAWDNLGVCHRRKHNFKEAIKCYKKSLEIDPMGSMPLMNMGVAYSMMEDFKSAAQTYEKYIKLFPEDPEGYFGAGKSYYLLKSYEKATDFMFKAYKIYQETKSPYINDAQNILSMMYQDLDRQGKLDIFKKAAKNNNVEID